MENHERYAVLSLELHLFSVRIMKEHALFLKVGFTPVNTTFAKETEFYKQEFEKLLCHAIRLSDGIVGRKLLHLMVKSSVAQNKTNRDMIQLDFLQKACKVA